MHSYHKHHRSSRQLRRTATPRFFYFCCSLVLMFAGVFAFFWLRGAPADALASATPSPTFSASAVQTPVPTAATPTPLPTHTPKASATQAPAGDRKDDAFFHNAVFIGNAQVEGLALFSGLKDTTYYASKGLTVDTIFTKPVVAQADGTSITIMQALEQRSFDRIYIMLGANELGWAYSSVFAEHYGRVIDAIKRLQPDATIYVQSLFPVTQKISDSHSYLKNNAINTYNTLIQQMAQEKGIQYLNVRQAVENSHGVLPEEASTDGVHLNKTYCIKWLDYIRTHSK